MQGRHLTAALMVAAAFFSGVGRERDNLGVPAARADGADGTDGTRAPGEPGLIWDAPSGCPDAAAARAALERWGARADTVRATARIRPAPRGWALELTLETPSGARSEAIVVEQCATIVDLVALKVALAADPDAVLRAIHPAVAPAPEHPPIIAV